MVVPVVLVMLTPPAPEPVTVMASNVLVPRSVPEAPPVASRPAAPLVVIEMLPVGAKITVPALLSRTPVAPLVLTVRLETLKVPVVASSSSPGWVPAVPVSMMLTSSIVPPPVSPVLPAMPPPVPLRVDVEAADLVAVVEVDHVGVCGGQGRVRARVGRVQGLGRERAALVGVDGQALVLADQPLAGVHGVAVAVVAGRGVVAVEDEHRVVGGRGGLGLGERVERGDRGAAVAGRSLLLTYQTQPAIGDRHAAGVGAGVGPGRLVLV